jgi:hypothetical protein
MLWAASLPASTLLWRRLETVDDRTQDTRSYALAAVLCLWGLTATCSADDASNAAAQANNLLANMTAFNLQNYDIGRLTESDKDGKLTWVTQDDGKEVIYHHDPESSAWQRFVAGFIGTLPVENQL